MANNVSVGTRVTGVGKASSDLDRFRDKFDKLQKQGAKGFGIGVGAAVTARGLGLLDSALSSSIQFMGDAVKAALEEEESIAKLDAALRANVRSYDGNNKAIEKVLASRMRLGWADDEQRDSLARLVSVTKDSTKALALQRTAMDLARLRGIDLAAASDIVGKVYGGNIGILTRYGIQLEKGISSTEALAEVQRRAAGQAEAFANTNQGKLLASQIAVNEKMEQLGAILLPLVVDGVSGFIKLLEDTEKELAFVGDGIGHVTGFFQELGYMIAGTSGEIERAKESTERLSKQLSAAKQQMAFATEHASDMAVAIEEVGDETESAAERVGASLDDIVDGFENARDRLTTIGEDTADAIYDPIIAAGEMAVVEREIAEQEQIALSKKSTKAQVSDAKLRLAELNKRRIGLLTELTSYGKLSAKQQTAFLADLRKKWNAGTAEQRANISRLIRQLILLKLAAQQASGALRIGAGIGTGTGGRAGGGPVEAKTPYIVGEEGRELFVPKAAGTIIPAGETERLLSGTSGGSAVGGSLSLTVLVEDRTFAGMTPGQARQAGEALGPALYDWGKRNGMWA